MNHSDTYLPHHALLILWVVAKPNAFLYMPGVLQLSPFLKHKHPAPAAAPGTAHGRGTKSTPRRATKMAAQAQQAVLDPDRPQCHVMAQRGWINDPNGPIYFDGKYHLCATPSALTWRFVRSTAM